MQFSFEDVGNPLGDAVNAFWFLSLVFSIASAVNSLLGLTWKQAMYRSPGDRVPWWVLIWIKRSPLVFLVVSVACFSIGLVVFAYSSNQSRVTSTVTTVFTSFSSFGLVAVCAWFASERWAYARHKGQKWLADVLDDFNSRVANSQVIVFCRRNAGRLGRQSRFQLHRSNTALTHARTSLRDTVRRGASALALSHPSADTLPTAVDPLNARPEVMSPVLSEGGMSNARPSDEKAFSPLGSPDVEKALGNAMSASTSALGHGNSNGVGNGPPPTFGVPPPNSALRGRFASAVRAAVVMLRATEQMSAGLNASRSPVRRRTASSAGVTPGVTRSKDLGPLGGLKASQLATLAPKLKSLDTAQELQAHQALVKHLQFSPDGRFLATSSWDRTSVIFKVGEPFEQWRILAHPQGFVGQVAWSPKGKLLMTKLNRGMKIWTEDGVCKRTIDRGRSVQSVTWLGEKEVFLSVEGQEVVKMDTSGNVLDIYDFDRMKLHDVAVTPDGRRLLAVGTLLQSEGGLQPSKSRAEKRILVYDMEHHELENQVPVLNEVRDITMARNGKVALVSYENKAPPQLWKLEMVKDRENPAQLSARLSLRHTYMPKMPVDFAGPSYFGGKDDELVLCAGKAGDVHMWHRESGALLHHVRAQALGGDLTCIAWNHAAEDPFMFATGSHDGVVRIWTTLPPQSAYVLGMSGPDGTSPNQTPFTTPVASLGHLTPQPHTPRPLTPRPPPPGHSPIPPMLILPPAAQEATSQLVPPPTLAAPSSFLALPTFVASPAIVMPSASVVPPSPIPVPTSVQIPQPIQMPQPQVPTPSPLLSAQLPAAFASDIDVRTDSPVADVFHDSNDGHTEENLAEDDHPHPRTKRIVSFSTPPARDT